MDCICKSWWVLALAAALSGCGRDVRSERIEWTVMGTVAAVQWRGECDASPIVASVKATFSEIERLLNAHDPDSELNRLASQTDGEILTACSASVRRCYDAAFRLKEASGGAFNPRWRGQNTMDLGAIAKGHAVDLAAERLGEVEADLLIDLGGNLRAVRGKWRVGVYGREDRFTLDEGWSCATSAEYFRGKHIYDPRTGQAVSNDIESVTVVTGEGATLADGLSTALFVLGPEAGRELFADRHSFAATKAVCFLRGGRRIEIEGIR